jgi:hypothetical protein
MGILRKRLAWTGDGSGWLQAFGKQPAVQQSDQQQAAGQADRRHRARRLRRRRRTNGRAEQQHQGREEIADRHPEREVRFVRVRVSTVVAD